jgi:hypothetical protein
MAAIVILSYRLRSGVDPAEYERWVLESDAPFVRSRGTVLRYEVYRRSTLIEGSEGQAAEYVELLEVRDLESDRALIEGPAGSVLDMEWRRMTMDQVVMLVDPVTGYRIQDGG